MKKSAIIMMCRGLVIFSLLLPALAGCASKKGGGLSDTTALNSSQAMMSAERFSWEFDDVDDGIAAPEDLLKKAFTALGTPYVRGGSAPNEGFDCSGFVQWAYQGCGVRLPRTAREQSVVGAPIKKSEDMRVGDIVAFWHPRRGYHTGIYVGDEKFIHSPRKRQVVRINSLNDPYFSGTFLGARRVSRTGDAEYERLEMNLQAYAATQGKMREIAARIPAEPVKKGKSKKGSRENMVAAKGKSQAKGKAEPTRAVAQAKAAPGKTPAKAVASKAAAPKASESKSKTVASLDKKSNMKSANDSLVPRPSKKTGKEEPTKKAGGKAGKDPAGKKSAGATGKNKHKNT